MQTELIHQEITFTEKEITLISEEMYRILNDGEIFNPNIQVLDLCKVLREAVSLEDGEIAFNTILAVLMNEISQGDAVSDLNEGKRRLLLGKLATIAAHDYKLRGIILRQGEDVYTIDEIKILEN